MLPFVLVCLAATACDRAESPRRGAEPSTLETLAVPAFYERRMVFVEEGAGRPVHAVLGFSVADSGDATRRRAHGWLFRSDWAPVLDEAWSMRPMREPWRLVPHGPLRLIAGTDERIEALIVDRPGTPLRIMPGTELATYATAPTLEYVLRQARMRVGEEEHVGVLLDLQRVRPLGDSAAGPDTGREIVVAAGEDTRLVVVDGMAAWIERGEPLRTVEGVRLVASAPDRWRIDAPGSGVSGELEVVGADTAGDRTRVHAVRGWIERAGRRRDVAGTVLATEPR